MPRVKISECVHILFRSYRRNCPRFVKPARYRKLKQNAVHLIVIVTFLYFFKQSLVGYVGRQMAAFRNKADLLAGAHFVAHINRRRGIVPYPDNRKTGGAPVFCCKFPAALQDPRSDLNRNLAPVNNNCHFDLQKRR